MEWQGKGTWGWALHCGLYPSHFEQCLWWHTGACGLMATCCSVECCAVHPLLTASTYDVLEHAGRQQGMCGSALQHCWRHCHFGSFQRLATACVCSLRPLLETCCHQLSASLPLPHTQTTLPPSKSQHTTPPHIPPSQEVLRGGPDYTAEGASVPRPGVLSSMAAGVASAATAVKVGVCRGEEGGERDVCAGFGVQGEWGPGLCMCAVFWVWL
jgi:hypothetical protein